MVALNVDYLDFNAKICNEQLFIDLDSRDVLHTTNYTLQNKRRDSVFYYHYDVVETSTGRDIGWFMAVTGAPERRTPSQRKICKFRFCDALFYERGFDFDAVKNEICNDFGLDYWGVSRLDIAFDSDEDVFFTGWQLDKDKMQLKKRKNSGLNGYDFMLCLQYQILKRDRRFNRSRTRSIDNYTTTEIKEILKDEAMSIIGRYQNCQTVEIGVRKSRCMARLYNKTVEMIAKGEKTFITSMWQNAGYDGKKPVYRFEIVLNRLAEQASYFYTEDGEIITPALNDFFDPVFLAGLFDGVIADKFVFAGIIKGQNDYSWTSCLSKSVISDSKTSYNCGYDVKKAVDVTDGLLHNNYTTWACGYLLSLTGRLRNLSVSPNDRRAIDRFATIFIDLHDDYKQDKPRERGCAASLIAAHREIKREYSKNGGWVVEYKKHRAPLYIFKGNFNWIDGNKVNMDDFLGHEETDKRRQGFGVPVLPNKKMICTEKN